jgi:hypothetical protein
MIIRFSKAEVKALCEVCAKDKYRPALATIKLDIYGGWFARLTSCDTYRLVVLTQGEPGDAEGVEPVTKYIQPKLFKALLEKKGTGRAAFLQLDTDNIGAMDLEGSTYLNIDNVMPEVGGRVIKVEAGAVTFATPYGVNPHYLVAAVDLMPDDEGASTWFTAKNQDPEQPIYAEFKTEYCSARYVISPVCLRSEGVKAATAEYVTRLQKGGKVI